MYSAGANIMYDRSYEFWVLTLKIRIAGSDYCTVYSTVQDVRPVRRGRGEAQPPESKRVQLGNNRRISE